MHGIYGFLTPNVFHASYMPNTGYRLSNLILFEVGTIIGPIIQIRLLMLGMTSALFKCTWVGKELSKNVKCCNSRI